MNAKSLMRWLFGLLFISIGVMHFQDPVPFTAIVPPALPAPLTLVYISGAIEFVLGILFLIPRTRRLAGWGLIALLIAVFPANIYAALNPLTMPMLPEWSLWLRLPFQIVFLLWVRWCTRPTPGQMAYPSPSTAATSR